MKKARKEGIKAGLIRPVTLWPFPSEIIAKYTKTCKNFLVVEMNLGQMVEDVRLAVCGKSDVEFLGRPGGSAVNEKEVFDKIKTIKGV
jgi:2-oxoglutarate ferredoxin oxidoreductase subunit alpha